MSNKCNYRYLLALCMWLTVGTLAAQPEPYPLSHTLTPLAEPFTPENFELNDLDGRSHSLADYRGKVVLINFWGTWCPPCIHEMPSMERLYLKLKDQPFTVLAINQWENEEHVFPFMGQLDVYPTFPILFDPTSRIADAFGVKGLPTSFVLDRQGRVVYAAQGGRAFDHPDIETLIRELF
jgi:thiol-disulfide isomerase/thioredoxin